MASRVEQQPGTDPVSEEDLQDVRRMRQGVRPLPVLLIALHRTGIAFALLAIQEAAVMGREADISIPDTTLSRRHARFTAESDKVIVEDLGSRNGTWVSSRSVQRAELVFGSEARLGAVVVLVRALPSGTDSMLSEKQRIDAEVRGLADLAAKRWALTRRQSEVLELLAMGKTNKEIAGKLGCQEGTVEVYVTQLLKKSASANRTELASRLWIRA